MAVKLLAPLVGIFIFLFIMGGRVSALEINQNGPNTGTSPGSRSWFAVGFGACPGSDATGSVCNDGFEGPRSLVYLYSKTSSMTVKLTSPGGGCGGGEDNKSGGTTSFAFNTNNINSITPNSGFTKGANWIEFNNNGSGCGAYSVDLATGNIADVDGSKYYVISLTTILKGNLDPGKTGRSPNAYVENSYRVDITSGGSSYVSIANYDSTIRTTTPGDYTGVYKKDSSSKYWSQVFYFAPPCSGVGSDPFISWFDADYSQYDQPTNPNSPGHIQAELFEMNRNGTGDWTPVAGWRDSSSIGESGGDSYGFWPDAVGAGKTKFNINKKYKWVWSGVEKRNTIQFLIPFDPINLVTQNCGEPYCKANDTGVVFQTKADANAAGYNLVSPGVCGKGGAEYACKIESPLSGGMYKSDEVPANLALWARNANKKDWDRYGVDAYVFYFDIFDGAGNRVAQKIYGENGHQPALADGGERTDNFGGILSGAIGSHTYTVRLMQYRSNNNVEERLFRADCGTINYTVYDEPAGDISVNCTYVWYRAYWQGRGTPLDTRVWVTAVDNTTGANSGTKELSGSVNPVNTSSYGEWSGGPLAGGTKLKPYKKYTYILTANDSSGNPVEIGSATINSPSDPANCFSTTPCTLDPPGSLDKGWEGSMTLTYTVTNNTNVDYTMSGEITAHPGLRITDPAPTTYSQTSRGGTSSPPVSRTFGVIADDKGSITTTILVDGANDMPNSDCNKEVRASLHPYIKAYNADVAAGGGFRTSEACTTSTGGGKGIFAYMRPMNEQTAPPSPPDPNPGKGGSGSQLGSFAWGTDARGNIEGFTSANTNSSNAISGSGLYLTFGGNSSYVTTDSNLSPKLGGNLNGNVPCIPSYWDTQYPDGEFKASLPSNNITGVESIDTNLTAKQFKIDNDATINNDILSYSGRRTYYIDGNLTISKDIKYFSYSNIKDIPNFTVVVKGNIYIAPGVSQLDGVYIAQPTDASGANGRIFTCNDGSPTFAITYDACSTQLKVNGAFIAQKVVLGRTYGTLDQSKYKEPANTSNAAEIFNFSPEVYLSPPVFKPIGTITSGTYDAMAILPPIF